MAPILTKFDETCNVSSHQVRIALSPARTSTYLAAQLVLPPCLDKALVLYRWNVELSGAVYWNLATCEVVLRNAVDDALSAVYGPNWPWSPGFIFSLNTKGKAVLNQAKFQAGPHATTGKVMAELTFGFWEKMFKGSFDAAIWNPHIHRVFPNLTEPKVQVARSEISTKLKSLVDLRNRIAHHEPLIHTNIQLALDTMQKVVKLRCLDTASWMARNSTVAAVMAARPNV